MSIPPRKDPKTSELLVDAAVLATLRRRVGRNAGEGREDAGASMAALASWLEDDLASRALLDEAAEQRRRSESHTRAGIDPSPRRLRVDREAEAHAAAGRLTLSGQVVADGLDRVVLPGFGAATWRAIALLRRGDRGPAGTWARAVAAGPSEDLGDARPEFLRALRSDPRLVPHAARVHVVQAARQDVRNALLVKEIAIGVALDAGNERGVEALRAECETGIQQIEHLDGELRRAWRAGLGAALSYAAAP